MWIIQKLVRCHVEIIGCGDGPTIREFLSHQKFETHRNFFLCKFRNVSDLANTIRGMDFPDWEEFLNATTYEL